MELDEFVKNTLLSVRNGIRNANKELLDLKLIENVGDGFALDNHDGKVEGFISFDVAVTVSGKKLKEGGGGIRIAAISLGGKISKDTMHEHVSRIKFHIMPRKTVV